MYVSFARLRILTRWCAYRRLYNGGKPAMTLSDTAMQLMRNTAIAMMRDLGNFAGGCNVQLY